jgi:hypothetical protein
MADRAQQHLQRQQDVTADHRRGHHAQLTTRGRLTHPSRYLYDPTCPIVFKTAVTDRLLVLDEHVVDGHRATEPGMPRITDFSRLGIMGVGLSTSIIGNGITRGSATG